MMLRVGGDLAVFNVRQRANSSARKPRSGQDNLRFVSDEVDHDVDVTARGFGVRARLMRCAHQGLSYAMLDAR